MHLVRHSHCAEDTEGTSRLASADMVTKTCLFMSFDSSCKKDHENANILD